MKREIKFRAWHRGRMTHKHSFNLNIGGQVYYLDTTGEWEQDELEEVILMQSTGFQDEINNDIFEGDLIADTGHIYQVHFGPYEYDGSNHTGFFTRNVSTGTISPIDSSDSGHVVIVGNIYQNPELLTQNAPAGSGTENV